MRHPILPGLVALAGLACASAEGAPRADAARREVVFAGACDASGAVPLSDRAMVVADDEDNVLRVYDADRGGPPRAGTDVSDALGVPLAGKRRPRPRELDLEAATRLGERAIWLTSHGRKKSGAAAPERLRLFATALDARPGALRVVGRPYDRLVEDLIAAPELAAFDLAAAARLAPKADGGLNIEGLTATPDGRVLVGFRSPLIAGRALIVPIEVDALLDGRAERARVGAPILLDLGGRGVRSLSWWRGRYLVAAGSTASGGAAALYQWDGRGDARPSPVDLAGYHPEAFFTPEDRDAILVLSDDGERAIDGERCKDLEPSQRRFRGVWLRP
jgi:hypothetical protein